MCGLPCFLRQVLSGLEHARLTSQQAPWVLIPALSNGIISTNHASFFTWILGAELKSSYVQGALRTEVSVASQGSFVHAPSNKILL